MQNVEENIQQVISNNSHEDISWIIQNNVWSMAATCTDSVCIVPIFSDSMLSIFCNIFPQWLCIMQQLTWIGLAYLNLSNLNDVQWAELDCEIRNKCLFVNIHIFISSALVCASMRIVREKRNNSNWEWERKVQSKK